MTSSPFPTSYTSGQPLTGKSDHLSHLHGLSFEKYLSFRALPFGPVDRRSSFLMSPPNALLPPRTSTISRFLAKGCNALWKTGFNA